MYTGTFMTNPRLFSLYKYLERSEMEKSLIRDCVRGFFECTRVLFRGRKREKLGNENGAPEDARDQIRIGPSLTLYTLTSVCIFSILFSVHFLRC